MDTTVAVFAFATGRVFHGVTALLPLAFGAAAGAGLRRRFDEPKIFLVGNSWGTTLGVLAVQRHPNLYHASVGTGQMVSQRETDRMFYEDTIAWAERTGNAALARRFREQGPPPYQEPWPYAALSYEREWNDYPRNAEYDARGEMPFNVFVNEYSLMEQVHAFNAFLDTAAVLYPQLQESAQQAADCVRAVRTPPSLRGARQVPSGHDRHRAP